MKAWVVLVIAVTACRQPAPDGRHWADRPLERYVSAAGGHAFTIELPEKLEVTTTPEGVTFKMNTDSRLVVDVSWRSIEEAREEYRHGQERHGAQVGVLRMLGVVPVDKVPAEGEELTIDVAGPEHGYLRVFERREYQPERTVHAYVAAGASGGFLCTARFVQWLAREDLAHETALLTTACTSITRS